MNAPRYRHRPWIGRSAALALAGALAACAAPGPAPPANPFLGAWATAERQRISFRNDTVVIAPGDGAATALDANACAGRFRFGYGRKSREAIAALIARQPDLRNRLTAMLVRPDYAVAELGCDQGSNTYILLDERNLLAVYRDGDIAGIERLSRL